MHVRGWRAADGCVRGSEVDENRNLRLNDLLVELRSAAGDDEIRWLMI